MKRIASIFILFCIAATGVFAAVTLPITNIAFDNIPEDGRWVVDDRTEFTKAKAKGIIEVPHPIINNAYLAGEDKIGESGEIFTLLNECSGMGFAFNWSVVRIMAVKETSNEIENFLKGHVERLGGSKFKVTSKDRNKKTGEIYLKYNWILPSGKRVEGYTCGVFHNKETVVNLTIEWTDNEGKARAKKAFEDFISNFDVKFKLGI